MLVARQERRLGGEVAADLGGEEMAVVVTESIESVVPEIGLGAGPQHQPVAMLFKRRRFVAPETPAQLRACRSPHSSRRNDVSSSRAAKQGCREPRPLAKTQPAR